MNTLDWAKLEKFIEERKPVEVSAGILCDWFWTAATVYEKGEWKDRDAAYVTSYWATPGFKATMENGDVVEVEASAEETPEQAERRRIRSEENRKEMHAMMAEFEAQKAKA